MRFKWASPFLRGTCLSTDGLTRANPVHAEEARDLLALVAAAESVAELRSFRCLSIEARGDFLHIRLDHVELVVVSTEAGLEIHQLLASGMPFVRAVS
jgi:hypothetical protein